MDSNEAARRKKVKDEYRAVFITGEADPVVCKKVLLDMLQFCRFFDTDLVKGDAEQTAINAGMKIPMANILGLLDMKEYAELFETFGSDGHFNLYEEESE